MNTFCLSASCLSVCTTFSCANDLLCCLCDGVFKLSQRGSECSHDIYQPFIPFLFFCTKPYFSRLRSLRSPNRCSRFETVRHQITGSIFFFTFPFLPFSGAVGWRLVEWRRRVLVDGIVVCDRRPRRLCHPDGQRHRYGTWGKEGFFWEGGWVHEMNTHKKNTHVQTHAHTL